ncbi:zincin-like metallopeptidase toxin domain-containing protein, partial [Zooshikella sp. RANM57]|uniref:zincin-like metallopeptidase toxin domain-containing protein n=1 Tax=Zooshikella sp. RANM57 TaxID=3425863 RepID=UPI003D6E161B
GTFLTVPNKVTNIHNNSSTFRPYNAGVAIGDVSPTLPDMPPPPIKPAGGGCGGAAVIIAVVAIAATIFTAGAAGAAMAAAGSAAATAGATTLGTMSLGASVLAGSAGLGFAATATAAFAGGVVGSLAGQMAGVAMGVQDGISFKQALKSGVTTAISAGVGHGLGQLAKASPAVANIIGTSKGVSNWQAVARAGISNLAVQGVQQAIGYQKKFDWRSTAASVISTGISRNINGQSELNPDSGQWEIAQEEATRAATSALVEEAVASKIYGRKFEFANVSSSAITGAIKGHFSTNWQFMEQRQGNSRIHQEQAVKHKQASLAQSSETIISERRKGFLEIEQRLNKFDPLLENIESTDNFENLSYSEKAEIIGETFQEYSQDLLYIADRLENEQEFQNFVIDDMKLNGYNSIFAKISRLQDLKALSLNEKDLVKSLVGSVRSTAEYANDISERVLNVDNHSQDKVASFFTTLTTEKLNTVGSTSLLADLATIPPYIGNAVGAGQTVALDKEEILLKSSYALGLISTDQMIERYGDLKTTQFLNTLPLVGGLFALTIKAPKVIGNAVDVVKDVSKSLRSAGGIKKVLSTRDVLWAHLDKIDSKIDSFVDYMSSKTSMRKESYNQSRLMRAERPVSGKGYLGGERIKRRELYLIKKELEKNGVSLVKNSDAYLDALGRKSGQKYRGGFSPSEKKLYLRRGATRYEVTHELKHARDFIELGYEKYMKLGVFERERRVYEKIINQKHLFNADEIKHATWYINDLAQKHQIKGWKVINE